MVFINTIIEIIVIVLNDLLIKKKTGKRIQYPKKLMKWSI